MNESTSVPTRAELRANMDQGLEQFLVFLDQLAPDDMLGPTDTAGWSVRDHLTHLAVWAEGIAALLRRENRWAAMGLNISGYDDLDLDSCNEQITRRHRHISPDDARAWLVAAHAGVAAAIDGLSDADLAAPYDRYIPPFTGDDGAPIFNYILGNTSHHYEEHTPWIEAIVHGDPK